MRQLLAIITLLLSAFNMTAASDKLVIADKGKTDYVIVESDGIGVRDRFAVKELKKFLKESTGAEFMQISSSEADKYSKRIFVGRSPLVEKLLGSDIVSSLKSQEALVMTKGNDLFLLGGINFGTNYAIYSFLENEVGVRWYTAVGDVFVPKHEQLTIAAVERVEKPVFEYRYISQWSHQIRPEQYYFFFRNRQNKGISVSAYRKKTGPPPAIRNLDPDIGPSCHTLNFYMNPKDKYHPAFKPFPKPDLKGLFKMHPDCFSMNTAGKRVDTMQVCFGNEKTRRLLTKQIEDVIVASGAKGVLSLDANDVPGHFCYCSECKKLEKQYGCIAGPLYDYLIELCGFLKKKYPDVLVKTLAYRKKQSEFPPQNIEKLPDNLVIVFAPIDDNFAATLNDPSNIETYENLKKWCKIAKRVWVWYYSNPYLAEHPPFGNIERMAVDVKLMLDAGVTGTQFEHGGGAREGFNFAELQTWLFLKLFQNPDRKLEPLVVDFTNYYYGKAAPLMRQYIKTLEQCRKQMKTKLPWNPSISMFGYLMPENVVKWQAMFDKMEQLVKDNKDHLFHVRKVRVSLDLETIEKYKAVRKQYPNFKPDLAGLEKRFRANYNDMVSRKLPYSQKTEKARMEKLLKRKLLMASLKEAKPLPASFNKYPSDIIKQTLPVQRVREDTDAAYGISNGGETDELPFTCGIYDQYNAKWMASKTIPLEKIKPDRYELYEICNTPVTQQCLFWGTQKWLTTVPLEQVYEVGNPHVKWKVYASLKFEGPKYGSKDKSKPNRVSCDRIVLIKQQKQVD